MAHAVGRRSVALVSRDNGVGLSADMSLLEGILTGAGYATSRVDWTARHMPRVDVAIFLELWSPALARFARRTVGVFNLEWFQPAWARYLPSITQLWAKSAESHAVYRDRLRLRNATLTGFASRDLMDANIQRTPTAIHLRGHSDFKNTHAVIEAWRRDPGLPELTIVSAVPLEVPHYVRVLGRISDEELRREMNTAAYHVCPSKAEGWGHYITEALSVGGIVITTDASPMNEHVRPEWGVLIPPTSTARHGMVNAHGVSARAIGDGVRRAMEFDYPERALMHVRARQHFVIRNEAFRGIALDLLGRI